jgi:hypothetical protein
MCGWVCGRIFVFFWQRAYVTQLIRRSVYYNRLCVYVHACIIFVCIFIHVLL